MFMFELILSDDYNANKREKEDERKQNKKKQKNAAAAAICCPCLRSFATQRTHFKFSISRKRNIKNQKIAILK